MDNSVDASHTDASHTVLGDALIVIDLQVDYFSDPRLGRFADQLLAATHALAKWAADSGCPVIEVRTVHAADGSTWTLDMLEDDQGMVIEGTAGAERLPGLELGESHRLVKTRDSAFHRTDLEQILAGRKRPVLAGVSTESCILATTIDAYARDMRCVLPDDAIASADARLHTQMLAQLRRRHRLPHADVAAIRFSDGEGLR